MKRNNIICFIAGAMIFGSAGVLAGQYTATDNSFPVKLNGNNVQIEGYNIEGSTYFKLRDIADVVGSFEVGFQNNTIQIAQNGYVYEEVEESANSVLKEYAKGIDSITNPDYDTVYTDVRFKIADVTGDGIDDLIAVAFYDGQMYQLEVYVDTYGGVEKIMNEHCAGYNGGYVVPVRYNDRIYITGFSYSSSTGFLRNLLKYENGDWTTAYKCYIDYDYETDTTDYVVNNEYVSKDVYNDFNAMIENSVLAVEEFVAAEDL